MVGRIIKGVGGLYTIKTKKKIYMCRPRGIFRKNKIKPCIGDEVRITILDEKTGDGAIEEIFERKTELIRPSVSNITQAVIVFSEIEPKINLDTLDRFIILAEEIDINIIICINKVKVRNDNINHIKELYENIGYDVVLVSYQEKKGIDKLQEKLINNITVFAGPSGVGKSTLINEILGYMAMETGVVSKKIKKGKHTTRHTELIVINENTYVVDSPGFTSLNIEHINSCDLKYYYKEFRDLSKECKYKDCNHNKEMKCKVKDEIGNDINLARYNRYVFLYNELNNKGRRGSYD